MDEYKKYSKEIDLLIKEALSEDVGDGDITSFFCVSPSCVTKAIVLAKEDESILCGIDVAKRVFMTIDPNLKIKMLKKDGETLKKYDKIMEIKGLATSILKAERCAINLLSMLSGISTYTNEFVNLTKDTKSQILDTRKTTPLFRILEKYAVRIGGGRNHRKGLWDGILIKDNHLRVSEVIKNGKIDCGVMEKIISNIRQNTEFDIEIEVENIEQFKKVAELNPDIIMLDNFSSADIQKAVNYRNKQFPKLKLEASGGITQKNVRKVALTGVDFISVGSITHSPKSIDFSLEIDE